MNGADADLHGELFAATQAISLQHRQRLETLGIDALSFRRAGGIGIARIDRDKDGSYQPTGSSVVGEVSLIWPVWYGTVTDAGLAEAELLDLVAWSPHKPDVLSRRVGDGCALGIAAIERASFDGRDAEPLRLYRTPLGWAKAGAYAKAICGLPPAAMILDWDGNNGLFHVAALIAEDLAHGEEIERRLKILRLKLTPRLPEIRVPKAVAAETSVRAGKRGLTAAGASGA